MNPILVKIKILVLALTFFITYHAEANHSVGAYFNYHSKPLNADSFFVYGTFTVLRDAAALNAAGFDDPIVIGVYFKMFNQWIFIEKKEFYLKGREYLSQNVYSDCIKQDIAIERGSYPFDFTLPISQGEYLFVHLRCCRTNMIDNIVSPESIGVAYHFTISQEGQVQEHESPRMNNFTKRLILLDSLMSINFFESPSTTDVLKYSWATPWIGGSRNGGSGCNAVVPSHPCPPPYEKVTYKDFYSSQFALGINSLISLDSTTGKVLCKADQVGNFLLGFDIDVSRNGIKLSTSSAEILVLVLPQSQSHSEMQGQIFFDQNENMQKDSGEILIGAYLNFKNEICQITYNSEMNTYALIINSEENNEIAINDDIWEINAVNNLIPIASSAPNSFSMKDIPLRIKKLEKRLNQSYYFEHQACEAKASYVYKIQNTGALPTKSTTLRMQIDSIFHFIDCSLPHQLVNNELIVQIPELNLTASIEFKVELQMPTNVYQDQFYHSSFILSDENFNDTLQHHGIIECKPKLIYKSVSPYRQPNYLSYISEKLIYSFYFTNTTGRRISSAIVEDKLSSYLDLNTFMPITASAPYKIIFRKGRLLQFEFPNIALRDSTAYGFVSFKIQPYKYDSSFYIPNQANIILDQNTIPTNYVYNSYFKKAVVKVDQQNQNLPILVYPNPVTNELIIEFKNKDRLYGNVQYQILNINSKWLDDGILHESKNSIDMSKYSNGIYFVRLYFKDKIFIYKVLKI